MKSVMFRKWVPAYTTLTVDVADDCSALELEAAAWDELERLDALMWSNNYNPTQEKREEWNFILRNLEIDDEEGPDFVGEV